MLYSVKDIVDLVAVSMLPLGLLCLIVQRIVNGKAIGARVIQFVAVIFLLPIILILAMEKILDATTIGTLLGAMTGYLLSGISNYDRKEGDKGDSDARRP